MHNKSFTLMAWLPWWEDEILVMPILGQGRATFFGFRCHGNRTSCRGLADDFARYWYCKSVSPLQQVWMSRKVKWRIASSYQHPGTTCHDASLFTQNGIQPVYKSSVDGTLPLIWAKTRLLSDDPAKGRARQNGIHCYRSACSISWLTQ